ncbi:MAG TPA: hypothetical protein VNN12_07825 [Dehalococcoidia bacterium]|nr:hypothetical protein [Dehalococcoidia bacterium]
MGTRTLNVAILAIIAIAVFGSLWIVFGSGGEDRLDWDNEFIPALVEGRVKRIEVFGDRLAVTLAGDDHRYEVDLPEGTSMEGLVRLFGLTTESGIDVVGYELPTPVPTPVPEETPAPEEE